MAARHISTAIKEERSLTDKEVALIEASTADSVKPGLVTMSNCAAPANAHNQDIINILVPTPDRLDRAKQIVETWGIKEPLKGDLSGSTNVDLKDAKTVLGLVNDLVKELKQKKGFLATALMMQAKAEKFLSQCSDNEFDDNYAIWDATSITKQVLSIGQDGASTYEPEDLSSQEDNYCQLQLALGYSASGVKKSFTFGYSFVYRTGDDKLATAMAAGSTDCINAIRILYAILMARDICTNGENRFKLVASNKPYPE